MSKEQRKRELIYNNKAIDRFNYIKSKTNLENERDILNAALTLFNWALQERLDGNDIAALSKVDNSFSKITLSWEVNHEQ